MPGIIQPTAREVLNIGGRVFTDLQNLITLYGNAGDSQASSLRRVGGTSGYQVPVGKIFRISAVVLDPWALPSGAYAAHDFGYADNDVGMSSGTALSNWTWLGIRKVIIGLNSNNNNMHNVETANVPAGKYVVMKHALGSGSSAMGTVYGYEVSI